MPVNKNLYRKIYFIIYFLKLQVFTIFQDVAERRNEYYSLEQYVKRQQDGCLFKKNGKNHRLSIDFNDDSFIPENNIV